MSKPKLLLISGISPFPQNSGGATRIKQTIFYLSKKYDIYFYFFTSDETNFSEKEELYLKNHSVSFKSFKLRKKSFFIPLANFIPYHFSNYFSNDLIHEFKNIQKEIKFDQIRIESTQILYLAEYLSKSQLSKFVSLDISTISFYRRAFASLNPFKIAIRLLSCLQIYLYENKFLPKFNKVLLMSEADKSFAEKIFRLKNLELSSNGIEKISFLSLKKSKNFKIGFVGSIEHTPNHKALDYLLYSILPALDKINFNYEAIILGTNNQSIYKSSHTRINFIDHVENLKDFYSQIDVLVAPLFSGSGTRLKILESLSYGKSVITTQIGIEGLNIETKFLSIVPVRLQNSVNTWVEEIVKIHNRKNMSKEDFVILKQQLLKFTWKNIFAKE